MKHLLYLLLFLSFNAAAASDAQWIWQKADGPLNTWMAFRKEITLDHQPKTALAKIAVDSKYWLWINGQMVVFEGGLKRGPNRLDTYADEVDLSKYLKKGNNTIAVLVWYWGKGGSSHNSSGKGGLYFDALLDQKPLVSDATWRIMSHPGYKKLNSTKENDKTDNRLAEWPVIFDNRDNTIEGWNLPGFKDTAWEMAVEKGKVPAAPWNNLVPRPIPFWKNSGLLNYVSVDKIKDKDGFISCKLPYDAQITPYLRIYTSKPGLVISIQTDQFSYGRMRASYTTAGKGWEEFECLAWMNGHNVLYQFPEGIEKWEVKYRETGYNTSFAGDIRTDDPFWNKMVEKAKRTLYINMRDIFMDCPDRERSQWWGDVVIELNEVFFSMDLRAHPLITKAIDQLIGWQAPNKSLSSPLPIELPTQTLASVSDGFWSYYMHTGDLATIKRSYPAVKDYLNLWTMNDTTGLINQRGANNGKVDRVTLIWNWDDHGPNTGENVDRRIIWNTWYYIAMKDARQMALLTGNGADADWYAKRISSIEKNFDRIFWNKELKRYRSSDYKGITDERAQAMAVYSGLAGKDKYASIREELVDITEASAYMEKYIDEALFIMGYPEDAMKRIKTRYSEMVNDTITTTLWEHFQHRTDKFGSLNHGWTGWPMTLLAQYNTGIQPTSAGYATFSVLPTMGTLNEIHQKVPSVKGEIVIDCQKKNGGFSLKVISPLKTEAVIGIPQNCLKLDFDATGSIKINNKPALAAGKYTARLKGITYEGLSGGYYRFKIQPGTWFLDAR